MTHDDELRQIRASHAELDEMYQSAPDVDDEDRRAVHDDRGRLLAIIDEMKQERERAEWRPISELPDLARDSLGVRRMSGATCHHAHHESAAHRGWRSWLTLTLPLGLVLCAACGVHACPDELAAALEAWRALASGHGALASLRALAPRRQGRKAEGT